MKEQSKWTKNITTLKNSNISPTLTINAKISIILQKYASSHNSISQQILQFHKLKTQTSLQYQILNKQIQQITLNILKIENKSQHALNQIRISEQAILYAANSFCQVHASIIQKNTQPSQIEIHISKAILLLLGLQFDLSWKSFQVKSKQ